MKKFLKKAASIIVLLMLAVGVLFLYLNRDQKLDFASILPQEIEHCGNTLGPEHTEYVELRVWFESNQGGWTNTPATYVPGSTYTGSTISVNVLENGVIVNYKAKHNGWYQVKRLKKSNELSNTCKKNE
ncbi:MAG: hypothetical protein ABUK01_11970 [Leptospirales bacterium]